MAGTVKELADLGDLAMRTVPVDLVDINLRLWLGAHGIIIRHAEIFYTPPFSKSPIHVDDPGSSSNPHAKMNFAYGGPGSTMRWYVPRSSSSFRDARTPTGTRSLILEENGGVVMHEATIGRPSLINAGVYHDVINPSGEGRWCLSLVMQQEGKRMSWETAKKTFAFCAKTAI